MIPPHAHFVWMGSRIPFVYVFAVRSAVMRSGLDTVTLHHTDALEPSPELDLLRATEGLTLRRLDPRACLATVGEELGIGASLVALLERVSNPVSRSNILRAAILHLHGGIYLDLDTITVRSLRPLLRDTQWVGLERIVWPGFVRRSRSPWLKLKSGGLSVLRNALRIAPPGYRWFRHVEDWYYEGVNGAVLGSAPRQPLMASYLRAMADVPRVLETRKHALGTHLLQTQVAAYAADDLTIHPPEVFYPLGPEISEHWFRVRDHVDLSAALTEQTRVVHWYASVRTRGFLHETSPEHVVRHANRQLYSALARPFVGDSVRWEPASAPASVQPHDARLHPRTPRVAPTL